MSNGDGRIKKKKRNLSAEQNSSLLARKQLKHLSNAHACRGARIKFFEKHT